MKTIYWIIRVYVITVILIMIFKHFVTIENGNLQSAIGAFMMLPAMWIDSLIYGNKREDI